MATGGNINQGGKVGTNRMAAGGQVNILPGKTVERDALIGGSLVVNAGRVDCTLSVSANQFDNTSSAQKVKFHTVEDQAEKREDYKTGFSIFGLQAVLGYFISGCRVA